MGCGGSKSTETEDQQGTKKQTKNKTVTVDDAAAEIVEEFGVDEAKAKKMAALADKNGDGEIDKKVLNKIKGDLKKVLKQCKDKESEDGTISAEDAQKVIKGKFPKVPDETVQEMVEKSDKDGNDRLSAQEVATLVVCTANMKATLQRRFKELDKDDSGELTSEELSKMMMTELGVGEAQVKIYIWVCDKDKDKNINLGEFMKMWSNYFS